MFIALINAAVWILLAAWLFPGTVGYVIVFWLLILVGLQFAGVGFWDIASTSSDERNVTINIDGKKYTGTVRRNDD